MRSSSTNTGASAISAFLVFVALWLSQCNSGESGSISPAQEPATQGAREVPVPWTNNEMNEVLGKVPEPTDDLPPGTAVWIRLGARYYRLAEFARVAKARVAAEGQDPPRPGRPLYITIDPDSKDAFVEVLTGNGMWQTNWAVTINRELKATHCTRAMGREGPAPKN